MTSTTLPYPKHHNLRDLTVLHVLQLEDHGDIPCAALEPYAHWTHTQELYRAADAARDAATVELKAKLVADCASADQLRQRAAQAVMERINSPVNLQSVSADLSSDHFCKKSQLSAAEARLAEEFDAVARNILRLDALVADAAAHSGEDNDEGDEDGPAAAEASARHLDLKGTHHIAHALL